MPNKNSLLLSHNHSEAFIKRSPPPPPPPAPTMPLPQDVSFFIQLAAEPLKPDDDDDIALKLIGLVDVEDAPDLSSLRLRFTGVLRGDLLGVFSVLEFVRLRPPAVLTLVAVVEDDVDEAGEMERSSFVLSLPRGLRPLLLLREVAVRLFDASQSSSYSASVLRLFLRF